MIAEESSYSNYSVSLDFYANSLGTDSCGGGYILTRFAQSGASYDEWYTREDIYSWQVGTLDGYHITLVS